MVCLVVVGDLRDLIGFVSLSIATSLEVFINENIFDIMEYTDKYARVEGSEDEIEHYDTGGDEVNQLDLDCINDEINFQN